MGREDVTEGVAHEGLHHAGAASGWVSIGVS